MPPPNTLLIVSLVLGSACLQTCVPGHSEDKATQRATSGVNAITLCHTRQPGRFKIRPAGTSNVLPTRSSYAGMVAIPGGTFSMGADNDAGQADEYPKHVVHVNGYWMDATEVTNAQFRAFVEATGYMTTAERKPEWEELRQQLPPETPKPPDSLLVASSLVFSAPSQPVSLTDYSQWWHWVVGADWRHPEGPGSSIEGRDTHPVVQVSWEDAVAYATWSGKRLPTEAEWEWAARGGRTDALYSWGNEAIEAGEPKANTWQGRFPTTNTQRDGYYTTAPVKAFPANGFGLYDMAGNVWEWCHDWYRADYYGYLARMSTANDPKGPGKSYDPEEPTVPKRVQRGGSFLCNDAYCSSYRASARMRSSPDTGLSHTGFRCVKDGPN